MKKLLLVLLVAALPANSAEFEFNGSVVKSSIKVNETKCKGYSILVKEDRFPAEVEDQVPAEIALGGFAGPDVIVGATAFLKKGSVEKKIPVPIEKYQEKGNLDGRNTYIPGSGYCLSESTFLLSLWSGGNCDKCELLIKYEIRPDGNASEVGLPSREELQKALGR